ncbi:MAG: AlbA family DNA-binding domain-containing protein [Candidatus Acidiferrales bacterium]
MTDAELLAKMRNFEDHFVERKTASDDKDWLKTIVAFANSTPPGFESVLYIGVRNTGEIEPNQHELDSLQKTLNWELKKAYPSVACIQRVIAENQRQALAVIVPHSKNRPHFSGPA